MFYSATTYQQPDMSTLWKALFKYNDCDVIVEATEWRGFGYGDGGRAADRVNVGDITLPEIAEEDVLKYFGAAAYRNKSSFTIKNVTITGNERAVKKKAFRFEALRDQTSVAKEAVRMALARIPEGEGTSSSSAFSELTNLASAGSMVPSALSPVVSSEENSPLGDLPWPGSRTPSITGTVDDVIDVFNKAGVSGKAALFAQMGAQIGRLAMEQGKLQKAPQWKSASREEKEEQEPPKLERVKRRFDFG